MTINLIHLDKELSLVPMTQEMLSECLCIIWELQTLGQDIMFCSGTVIPVWYVWVQSLSS